MSYISFVAFGWAYVSYPGWVSWGLMMGAAGGGVLPGPSMRYGALIFPQMSLQM